MLAHNQSVVDVTLDKVLIEIKQKNKTREATWKTVYNHQRLHGQLYYKRIITIPINLHATWKTQRDWSNTNRVSICFRNICNFQVPQRVSENTVKFRTLSNAMVIKYRVVHATFNNATIDHVTLKLSRERIAVSQWHYSFNPC